MPVADIATGRDTISALFKAAVDALLDNPKPQVYWDPDVRLDLPPVPESETGAHFRFAIVHADRFQTTVGGEVGQRRFSQQGFAQILVYTPHGSGLSDRDRLVNVAVRAYEGVTGSGGILFRPVTQTEVGQLGKFFVSRVIAEFEYDTVH